MGRKLTDLPAVNIVADTDKMLMRQGATSKQVDFSKIVDRLDTSYTRYVDTLADAIADTTAKVGMVYIVKEHTAGNGGGAVWDVITKGTTVDVDLPNTFDIAASTGDLTLALKLRVEYFINPSMIGGVAYRGLRSGEPSSITQINRAYQISFNEGVPLTFGGLNNKFFVDDEFKINHNFFKFDGGILECLPTYTGVVLRLGTLDPLEAIDDSVGGSLKFQTTLENDATKTRAEKEGNYIGVLHDTAKRPVFNVHLDSLFIMRPDVALQWDGGDGSGNDFSTTVIYNNLSILGYKTGIQVLATAGIVGENQLNNCVFLNQRTTPGAKLFDIRKGTSFMVNDCYHWNDGDQTFQLFDITVASRMAVISINGGYWEADANAFINSQVAINGNLKITSKPGSTPSAQSIIFQPNVTSGQVDNLIASEFAYWIKIGGATVSSPVSYFQGRPMSTLNGIIRYDIGAEFRFAESKGFTFSCWMEPDTASTASIDIQITYGDATSDTFSSGFAISNGVPQLIGVDVTPTGLDAGKVPTRILVTVSSGSGTSLIGIPVISLTPLMPLYNVPLAENGLPKLFYNTFADGDATPKIRDSYWHETANTSATTLTDFDDGFVGQEIYIKVKDANTSIDLTSAGNIRGNNPTGGISVFPLGLSDVIKCEKDIEGRWYCNIMRGAGL